MSNSLQCSSLLIVGAEPLSGSFVRAARQIMHRDLVTIVVSSGKLSPLSFLGKNLVISMSHETDSWIDQIEIDTAANAANARYLPIQINKNELFVGPLFGPQHSCAACWAIRQSLSPSDHDLDKAGLAEESVKIALLRSSLARLAASACQFLLETECCPFTSPYFVYDMQSRLINQGTLVSSSNCATCTNRFRERRVPNSDLQKLIRTHVEDMGRRENLTYGL